MIFVDPSASGPGSGVKPPRKCAVETAQCWYDDAKKRGADRSADYRVLCMENAFNHTENALFATRDALERALSREAALVEALKIAREDIAERADKDEKPDEWTIIKMIDSILASTPTAA